MDIFAARFPLGKKEKWPTYPAWVHVFSTRLMAPFHLLIRAAVNAKPGFPTMQVPEAQRRTVNRKIDDEKPRHDGRCAAQYARLALNQRVPCAVTR